MKTRLWGAVCACIITFISTLSNAALVGRLAATSGGTDYQAYYDDQLDITWTADANINGLMDWSSANTWAAGLTINGVIGWQLPDMDLSGDDVIVDCNTATQAECMDNQYAHLFHYGAGTTLGDGITSTNPSPFSNVLGATYWSGTEYAPDTNLAWRFDFGGGSPANADKNLTARAWAVRSGDVGAVPVPAAVWLFGSGLLGLLGIARKKAA